MTRLLDTLKTDYAKGKTMNNIIIKNATPHICTIMDDSNFIVHTIKPDGTLIRIPENEVGINYIRYNNKSINIRDLEHTSDSLPISKFNVYWIVSRPVAMFYNRSDFIVPDEIVRDTNGQVIGCKSFARFYKKGK